MSRPDVSIIIATYNLEAYIERAVRSALAQTEVEVEVLVVDDCSKDGTVACAESIQDARITIIRMPQNGGPSAARNAGIAAAQGQWIAILDGDDAFKANRLKLMLDQAARTKADIVIDNLLVTSEEDGSTAPMFPLEPFNKLEQLDLVLLMRGQLIKGKGYPLSYVKPLISADFLRSHELAYNPAIRIGEDYLFLAEALARGAVCRIVHQPLYLYTRRIGSISHRIPAKDWGVMIAREQDFLARHQLTGTLHTAQMERFAFMQEMQNYEATVEALKHKNFVGAIKLMACHPLAARRLAEPLIKRLKKLAG